MPNDTRYSPPTAIVADPPPQPVPKKVRLAVNLLWLSLALAVPVCYLGTVRSVAAALFPLMVAIYVFVFGFYALLYVQVYRGKNWARIVVLILALIGALFLFFQQDGPTAPGLLERSLDLVSTLLDFSAMYLVFTKPGAAWFKRPD
jgi:hypothetical protein